VRIKDTFLSQSYFAVVAFFAEHYVGLKHAYIPPLCVTRAICCSRGMQIEYAGASLFLPKSLHIHFVLSSSGDYFDYLAQTIIIGYTTYRPTHNK